MKIKNAIDNINENEFLDESRDIFSHLIDYGLNISLVYKGNSICTNSNVVSHSEVIKYIDSLCKSISIRIKSKYDFYMCDDIFNELNYSINRIKSEFNLKLNNIHLRTVDGRWFSNIESMMDYLKNYNIESKYVLYMDISFRN